MGVFNEMGWKKDLKKEKANQIPASFRVHSRVEASTTLAKKFRASLSKRVAMRLKCLSLQKNRSTRFRWR